MASRSADWVLGEERLISSAMTMFAKMAPGLNSNSRSTGLNTLTPVTSPGSRSGVNWMRRTVASTEAARARASMVLPTPGTSSMSRCPSASRQTSELRTASGLPSITVPTAARIASVTRANPSAVSAPAGASGPVRASVAVSTIEASCSARERAVGGWVRASSPTARS